MNGALEVGRQVVADEAEALRRVAGSLGAEFDAVIQRLLTLKAPLIVSGIGKSGAIAQKIAASLTSTGTPATFMHPVEALHGDLGLVSDQNALIALSRSGATEEILRFVTHFRRLGGPVIGVTQGRESRLVELSHLPLLLPDLPEAGPLQLAPTTSCVMMLALGDALAMALLHARGFKANDFAQYHPEGALGRRLLLRAEDLMHKGRELPIVDESEPFDHLLMEMTSKGLGLTLIARRDGALLGVFTDGDLRRLLQRTGGADNPRQLDAAGAWRRSRRDPGEPAVRNSRVTPAWPAVDCLRLMRESQITSLVVVNDGERPVGILRLMDLVAAGLA